MNAFRCCVIHAFLDSSDKNANQVIITNEKTGVIAIMMYNYVISAFDEEKKSH